MYQENRPGGRMNKKQAKKIRKYILENLEECLLKVRNEFGIKTEQMGPRQLYQNVKRMYKDGKISI